MPRRTLFFVLFALAVAAACARLGMWQLDRRNERRAFNAEVEGRLRAAPTPWRADEHEDAGGRLRRVTLVGVADYANERVLASRTRGGSPGVHLLTPVRPLDGGAAVVVNRGWAYAPDGMSVDQARWREGDTLTISGYVEHFGSYPGAAMANPRRGRPLLRQLDFDLVERGVPYPIAGVLVVATDVRSSPPHAGEHPARLALPTLDAGPHLGYAIQWFAFAAIAVVGVSFIAIRSRPTAPKDVR